MPKGITFTSINFYQKCRIRKLLKNQNSRTILLRNWNNGLDFCTLVAKVYCAVKNYTANYSEFNNYMKYWSFLQDLYLCKRPCSLRLYCIYFQCVSSFQEQGQRKIIPLEFSSKFMNRNTNLRGGKVPNCALFFPF